MTEFLVLGPVEIRAGDQPIRQLQPRQHHVLAALLVDLNRPVSWDTLVDRVWGAHPPEAARQATRSHVSRIRRALRSAGELTGRPGMLLRGGGGYELRAEPDQVDLHRLRRLAERARLSTTDVAARAGLLREAVTLWRGEPLAGLTGEWVGRVRAAWQNERLEVVAAWAAAELDLGNPAAVLSALTEAADEHPLVESIAAVHVRALHAVGRTTEAIERYLQVRSRLADDLGVSPGADLQRAHRITVRKEPTDPGPTGPTRIPAQPPPEARGFVGRRAPLATLDTLLDPGAGSIAVVRGTAGIGKTALADYWAHRVVDHFPDGRLHVDLRGFDPVGPALDPGEAIRRFLDTLDVPSLRIPADLDAAAALYRSELAGRRILVVLDNARDEAQVRPLLPGTPGCVTVVTSREPLNGLVAAEGAQTLDLDLLSTDEAAQLLGGRLGSERLVGEWAAVSGIIERCARLPLALAVAAARAAARPRAPLSVLANELGLARDGLDAPGGNDPLTDLRAVLSHSYRALSEPARRMFRLLGLHPGADLTAPSAASLAALPQPETAALITEITDAALLTERSPGRYTHHDLLRAYAAELAVSTDPDHPDALRRVLDHYLHTAYSADRRLYPGRDPVPLGPSLPGTVIESFADDRRATDWFAAESANVLSAVQRAVAEGLDQRAWLLVWTLRPHLERHGQWAELAAVTGVALAAAERLGDPALSAQSHHHLGSAWIRLSRFDDAERELTVALGQHETLGDLVGQGRAHHQLSYLFERRAQPEQSLHHARQALAFYRKGGHRNGEAHALNGVGWCSARLGDHRGALAACQEALALFQELGDRPGEANTWDSIGFARLGLGDAPAAAVDYHRALAIFCDLGARYNEASTLTHLGDAQRAAGDPAAARATWRLALTILTDLRHPDLYQVRARLEPGNGKPGA